MVSKAWAVIAGVMLVAAPQIACAADDAPVCTAPGTLPDGMASWTTPVALNAGASASGLGAATLALGQAAKVRLLPTPAVTYPLRPAKAGDPASFGGLLQVVVPARGTYRVALDSSAWIDVVAPGNTAVDSIGHSHGAACSGVHKMVDFVLEPGAYTIEIAAAGSADGKVMVLRLP